MAVSLQSQASQEARLLEQKEKIKAVYDLLLDVPEERLIFDRKKVEVGEAAVYQTPENLRWLALRIKQRIQEAAEQISEAIERSEDGVLDLSHKDLCDLTLKDFYAPLPGIWKIKLSGNHLRSLPPLCQFQPYIQEIEAVGNCEPVDVMFDHFRRTNSVNIDVLETLRCLKEHSFTLQCVYRSLFDDIQANSQKLSLAELAKRVHSFLHKSPIDLDSLKISPEEKEDEGLAKLVGGVRGYISLNAFASLKHLDLSGCRLEYTAPSDWLLSVSQLETLKLNNTTIRNIPTSLLSTKVSRLEMRSTGLRQIPEWLHRLATLQALDISDCPVEALPESFKQLKLQELRLDRTHISSLDHIWPGIDCLSLKGTPVLHVPGHLLVPLRDGLVIVDASCSPVLIMQKNIISSFHNLLLGNIVFSSEKFKRSSDCSPTIVKTQLVALEYFSFIGLLGLWGVALFLATPASMGCTKRHGMESPGYKKFKTQAAYQGMAAFLSFALYHMLPAKHAWQDMRKLFDFFKL